jgi:hypothetical protein
MRRPASVMDEAKKSEIDAADADSLQFPDITAPHPFSRRRASILHPSSIDSLLHQGVEAQGAGALSGDEEKNEAIEHRKLSFIDDRPESA